MATCEHGYILGDKDAGGCPTCHCSEPCETCESKKPAVMVVQPKETCNDCDKQEIKYVQTVKEECHECETTGKKRTIPIDIWRRGCVQNIVFVLLFKIFLHPKKILKGNDPRK